MSAEQSTDLLPRRLVSERYGVNPRTVVRWEKDPGLGFPQPITINGRAYFSETELTAFDRTRRPASSAA
jgi:MerR HTH family regulatory protein